MNLDFEAALAAERLIPAVGAALAIVGAIVFLRRERPGRYREKHVLVTGGSSGIGLALAELFVREYAHVTVLARNKERLAAALERLKKSASPAQKITALSADVTVNAEVQEAVKNAEKAAGRPIDVLVTCAGASLPGYFLEQDVSVFDSQMKTNYFGALYAIRCVAPGMAERGDGHVVIISSAMALIGFVGYAAYAPAKWALRGLADCLRNELKPRGVRVSIGYPPDTDTPGFENENKTKPKEVWELSGGSVYTPEKVAATLLRGIKAGRYHLPCPDVGVAFLVGAVAGVSSRPHPLLDTLLAPLYVLGTIAYRCFADYVAAKHFRRRQREAAAATSQR